MEILFIGPNPRTIGGIETFGRNLSRVFTKKICFLSFTSDKKEVYFINKIYEGASKNLFEKVFKKILPKYRFAFILKRYNIFILNTPKYLKYFKKNNNQKKILVQHQTAKLYWERDFYFSKNIKLLERAVNEVDIWVTLSPFDREEFIKKFKLEKEKVTYIRHTSEMPLLKEKKKRNKNLIMVCRLYNHHKRIDLAILAMKRLSDFTLNIYGEGPDRNKLESLVKKLELKNVYFHGSTNKVQEKLDENGIYIMTSDYEGYGISNIEAMRRGLPIILRNTFTAAQDIVQGNGVLLEKKWKEGDYLKAVEKVYNNYQGFSKKSLELGKRYDFEVIKNEWCQLLEKVIK